MSRATISASTRERLAKLLPLLSSDKAGEVAATAAAIMRTLRKDDADLHDLVAALDGAPAPSGARRWAQHANYGKEYGRRRAAESLYTDEQLAMLVRAQRSRIADLERMRDFEVEIGCRLRRERDSARAARRKLVDMVDTSDLAIVRARLVSVIAIRGIRPAHIERTATLSTAQTAPPTTAADRRAVVIAFVATPEAATLSNREIGRRLGVNPQTVSKYRAGPLA